MPDPDPKPITHVDVHMFTLGTGDCFVLKFRCNDEVTFKMLIDCGFYSSRKFDEAQPYLETLMEDVDNHVDALVVTHEHDDHVRGFQAGKEMFTDPDTGLKVDRVWMAWSEDDDDDKVKDWKEKYGQKKKALAEAALRVREVVADPAFREQYAASRDGEIMVESRGRFSKALDYFAELHISDGLGAAEYKGLLKGMEVVKENFSDASNTSYFKPGKVLTGIPGLDGVRIFVLGPPELHSEVDVEPHDPDDAYRHNKELDDTDLFVGALGAAGSSSIDASALPFDESFVVEGQLGNEAYDDPDESWRRIDDDWLFSSGNLALRLNSMTNNLTLCLAIEHEASGKVLLFPGDAEVGSWKSWHTVDWQDKAGLDLKTNDLLNRVVFYKVAHHLSHNGTAKAQGLELMSSPNLCAMASLDYEFISKTWTSTMPSRAILKELLQRTKGRVVVMNADKIHYDLDGQIPLMDKIEEYRGRMTEPEREAFHEALDTTSSEHYIEYTITL